MTEYEILKKLLDKIKEKFISELEEKGTNIIEKRKKQRKNDEYYENVIKEITENIPDEWESENVIEYVTLHSPIDTNVHNSIFSEKMRQDFIDAFYKRENIPYSSERITKSLEQYLNSLEEHLELNLFQKIIFGKMNELQMNVERIGESVNKIDDHISKTTIEDSKRIAIRKITEFRLKAALQCYLEKENIDDENIGKDEYQEEIYNIRSIFCKSWKEQIIKLLYKGINNKSTGFRNKMKYIEGEQEYEIVLKLIKQIVEEYDCDIKIEDEINFELTHPHFNRVCLISGSMGSGKTLFIRNFIRYNIQNPEFLVLPMHVSDLLKNDTIEESLVNWSNTFMNMQCMEFEEFIKQILNLEYKMCIVIENIHELYILNKAKFADVINLIKKYTKFDKINWIFTINEYEYFIFQTIPEFLNRYCIDEKCINNSFFKSSFNLGDYNVVHKVIEKILDYYNVKFIQTDYLEMDILNDSMETPFNAHILGKCCVGEEIIPYPESYFEYIKIIVSLLNGKVSQNSNVNEILYAEKEICKIMIKKHEICYDEDELKNIDKASLDYLQILHLISYVEKCKDDIFSFDQYRYEKNYRLRIEVFWAMKFVLYHENIMKNKNIFLDELLSFPGNFRDILIPCYLMYIDKEMEEIEEILEKFFDKRIGYYPLFCARKASKNFEKSIFTYLVKNTVSIDIKMVYSLLYYIYFSKLKIKEKFILISMNAEQIENVGLLDIYENIFRQIISKMKNEKNLKRNIIPLVSCKVASINVINGYVCGHRYVQILKASGKTFEDGIENIEMYVHDHNEILLKIEGRKNDSFMDYFIRSFYEQYLYQKELISMFNYLNRNKFFNLQPPLGIYFKKNFTCAAGNIYSKNPDRKGFKSKYENLTNILSMSENLYDNLTAWFLILNSISKENEGINKNLVPAFVRLWEKKKFREEYKNHTEVKQILKYNVNELKNVNYSVEDEN